MRVRSPLALAVLALLARRPGPGGTADATLLRWGLGAVAVRLLAPLALVPLVLLVSLVGVLGVVLVLAGGITVAARVTGLG